MDANEIVNKLNGKMSAKSSDVFFYWSATHCDNPDPKTYFLLWGYRQSGFSYTKKTPTVSVFLFKGMPSMLADLMEREGELEKFEKYVLDSIVVEDKTENYELQVSKELLSIAAKAAISPDAKSNKFAIVAAFVDHGLPQIKGFYFREEVVPFFKKLGIPDSDYVTMNCADGNTIEMT